jgi:hypothetical protein
MMDNIKMLEFFKDLKELAKKHKVVVMSGTQQPISIFTNTPAIIDYINNMPPLKEQKMKVYAIKHIPTGLYIVPSREVKNSKGKYVKSNLSKTPKIKTKKPTAHGVVSWYCGKIYSHFNENNRNIILLNAEDIEIVEIN